MSALGKFGKREVLRDEVLEGLKVARVATFRDAEKRQEQFRDGVEALAKGLGIDEFVVGMLTETDETSSEGFPGTAAGFFVRGRENKCIGLAQRLVEELERHAVKKTLQDAIASL